MRQDGYDLILKNLLKIETGIGKICHYLSKRESFRNPVKKFRASLSEEEKKQAGIFQEIAGKLNAYPEFDVEISLEKERLQDFADQVNPLLKGVTTRELTESADYSIGSTREADLAEANFVSEIRISDMEIPRKIQRKETETVRHKVILHNHTMGVR